MSDIPFEYTEGDWLGWACAIGGFGLLLLGAGAVAWFFASPAIIGPTNQLGRTY
jgi:hypothetical protein